QHADGESAADVDDHGAPRKGLAESARHQARHEEACETAQRTSGRHPGGQPDDLQHYAESRWFPDPGSVARKAARRTAASRTIRHPTSRTPPPMRGSTRPISIKSAVPATTARMAAESLASPTNIPMSSAR